MTRPFRLVRAADRLCALCCQPVFEMSSPRPFCQRLLWLGLCTLLLLGCATLSEPTIVLERPDRFLPDPARA